MNAMTAIRVRSARSRDRLGWGLLALSMLLATTGVAQTERPDVRDSQGPRPQPRVAIDNVCAWPNLTVLRDGTIIATIFNQPSHGLLAGDVECWASQDGGANWTKRGTPAPRDSEDSNRMNVAAGLADNGDLLVIASGWSSCDAAGKPGQAFRERILPPWVSRSSDGGRTWTIDAEAFPAVWPESARDSRSPEGACVPFGDILPGQDSALRVAVYLGGRGAAFVYRSSDDGKTWAQPVAFDQQAVIHEPALFHLGGGRWLCAARFDGLNLYGSDDDGQTWSLRQKLTDKQQHPGHFTRLGNGQLLLTYGNRVIPRGVDVRFSDDEGRTWSPAFRVADFEGDGGYPSSVARPDGQVLTAFYASKTATHPRYHMGVVVWDPAKTRDQ